MKKLILVMILLATLVSACGSQCSTTHLEGKVVGKNHQPATADMPEEWQLFYEYENGLSEMVPVSSMKYSLTPIGSRVTKDIVQCQ